MIKAEQPTKVEMRRYVVNDIALKTFNRAQQILVDAGRRKVKHTLGEGEVKILANPGKPTGLSKHIELRPIDITCKDVLDSAVRECDRTRCPRTVDGD